MGAAAYVRNEGRCTQSDSRESPERKPPLLEDERRCCTTYMAILPTIQREHMTPEVLHLDCLPHHIKCFRPAQGEYEIDFFFQEPSDAEDLRSRPTSALAWRGKHPRLAVEARTRIEGATITVALVIAT